MYLPAHGIEDQIGDFTGKTGRHSHLDATPTERGQGIFNTGQGLWRVLGICSMQFSTEPLPGSFVQVIRHLDSTHPPEIGDRPPFLRAPPTLRLFVVPT